MVMKTFFEDFPAWPDCAVGYALATPETAARITSHLMSWPNVTGLAAAKACVVDEKFISYSRGKIFEGRQMVNDTLAEKRNHAAAVGNQFRVCGHRSGCRRIRTQDG